MLMLSCATNYEKMGRNGGYAEEKINDRVYKITFQGNTRTSDKKVYDYFMRRSAEVALLNHYQYFTIIESEDITRFMTITSEGAPATKAKLTVYSYSGKTIYKPTEYKTIPKHILTGKIQFFKEGEQPMNAYSVENILKNVKI